MHSTVQPGDQRKRLDEVARRYYAPLLSFFRKRARGSLEVQDLVQQVFLRLAQHPHLGAISNPDAYIFQTAANALRDHHRRSCVYRRLVAEGAGGVSPVFADDGGSHLTPERVLQARESMAVLEAALRELPERTRDIFTLRCFEGLKHQDIARLQGISVRAVEKHCAKALAHLGAALAACEVAGERPP